MAGRFSDLIQRMPDSCEVRTPACSDPKSSFSDRAESGGVGGGGGNGDSTHEGSVRGRFSNEERIREPTRGPQPVGPGEVEGC